MKPRVTSVETVPTARRQRTPPPAEPTTIDQAWPKDATGYHDTPDHKVGLHVPGTLGRFPTVGIDEGAVKNTRPDTSPITKR